MSSEIKTSMEILMILGIIGVFIYFWNKKISFYKDRNGKKKIIGEFVKYEHVTEQVLRNETETTIYPFVIINKGTEEAKVVKLNFTNAFGKSFKKGEKVELFWCNNKLLHWNAYEIGLLKFFPKKWFF